MSDYQQIIASLRMSYNREEAERRNQVEKESWKIAERQHFLDLLHQEGNSRVLMKKTGVIRHVFLLTTQMSSCSTQPLNFSISSRLKPFR